MKVRFQADADLKHAIVSTTLCREPMVDFQTAIQLYKVSLGTY